MFALGLPLAVQTAHEYMVKPDFWPTGRDFVTWCQNMDPITGAILILGGTLFLFSGFKMHRLLVALTGAVIGAYLGAGICMRGAWPLYIGIPIGALIFGIVAWYITPWAAAAIGAICGALFGAALWNIANLNPQYAWSGALTGAVALGLLCFITFRISVMLFTSLQGAVMLVLGVLGLAYQYSFAKPTIERSVTQWPYFLPALVFGLMTMGLVYQYLKGPGGGKAAPASASSGKKPARKEKAEA